MAEKTMTLAELRQEWTADIGKAIEAHKPESPAAMKQDGGGAPQQVQSKTVTQDGAPVDAKQASMAAFGIGGMVERADVKVPYLNVMVPVGAALAGTFLGVVVGDVMDHFVSPNKTKDGVEVVGKDGKPEVNFLSPLAQVAAAAVTLKYGSKYIGSTAAMFAAGSIVVRLALRYTPMAEWIGKVEEKIIAPIDDVRNVTTKQMRALPPGNVAERVASRSGMSIAYQY